MGRARRMRAGASDPEAVPTDAAQRGQAPTIAALANILPGCTMAATTPASTTISALSRIRVTGTGARSLNITRLGHRARPRTGCAPTAVPRRQWPSPTRTAATVISIARCCDGRGPLGSGDRYLSDRAIAATDRDRDEKGLSVRRPPDQAGSKSEPGSIDSSAAKCAATKALVACGACPASGRLCSVRQRDQDGCGSASARLSSRPIRRGLPATGGVPGFAAAHERVREHRWSRPHSLAW